ncbi:MAG: hypothetical protein RR197_00735 [Oscillospiraceae bacterium]
MAINLATNCADSIASVFSAASYLANRTAGFFDFTGVKGLRVYTPVTVPLCDYTREGANRYGAPAEMQDTVQELVMTQDKGFALTIDKGNNAEQMNTKAAGQMLNLQIAERVVPTVDKYALSVFLRDAGRLSTVTAEPTKATILEEISKASQALDDEMVPGEDRTLLVTSKIYSMIRLSPEFLGVESLGAKALGKGAVGELFGAEVVKLPGSYLPDGCYFVLWHKSSVLMPSKLRDAKIHADPPGISGSLLEGRWLYDAFVLGARASGVCALVLASLRQSAPTVSYTGGSLALASGGASRIVYTVDGTDPRYSASALTYSAAVSTAGWKAGPYAVQAVAYANDKFTSELARQTITVS